MGDNNHSRCDGCLGQAAPIEFWKEKPEGLIHSSFRFCVWCYVAFRKGEKTEAQKKGRRA